MKPTHAAKPFTANRVFTDREPATARFRRAFDGRQPRDAYRVLNWYGVGGEGKSRLSEELMKLADAIAADAPAGHRVARARVNFDYTSMRRTDEALLAIRLQLARTFGSVFPCFDTAYARHFVLTNPGIDIRRRHPELFKGENAVLDDLLDLSEGGIAAEVAGAVSDLVPGLNLLYRYGTRLSVRVREWFQRRGKTVLQGLDDLTADALMERLPSYLGADLCDHLAERAAAGPGARALIVLDTHEALWRERNLKDMVQGAQADAWLRRLVQDAPGVLFAIFGRNKLRWSELRPDWGPVVEGHRLGALSDTDADLFLRQVPIADPAIRAPIVQGAQGLPFYLDLQVSHYERLLADGQPPDPTQFGGSHPEILRRFLDHLSEVELSMVRLAAYPQELTEAETTALAGAFLGGIGHLDWGWLRRQGFFETDADGDLLMHALMRDALQGQDRAERPETFAAIHRWLFERYDALARPAAVGAVTRDSEIAFARALHHRLQFDAPGFFPWFWARVAIYRDARRSGFLEGVLRDLTAHFGARRPPEDLDLLGLRHNLAQQIGRQGRYREAEEAFRVIWEIRRRPEVLGEEHPRTLATRHNLAWQIGNQGRYREAEETFRAIWEIKRRPEVLGEEHPHTLTTRHNLAQQIGNQGRYREAEEAFRAIWEVLRHPDVLGEEHADTLATRANLAYQIGNQGRYREAEEAFRAIGEIQRRPEVLGEEHPHTLSARHNLAQQIGNQGRHREAEEAFRAIWEIERRPEVLGEEHPDTLTTRHNLALEIGSQGRFREAEEAFRAIWEIRRRPEVLGEEHPHTLTTRHLLAQQIGHQGRYREAESELRAVWEGYVRVLGPDHPNNLRTRYWLAKVLDGQGRHAEADELLAGLEAQMSAQFPETHRWVLDLREHLRQRGRS